MSPRRRQTGDTMGLVIFAVLMVLLVLSCLANLYFWRERDKLVTEKATVTQLKVDVQAAASSCSASVDQLAKDGRGRNARIEKALEAIAPGVLADQLASMAALGARPDNPKDLCGSLDRFRKNAVARDREPKK